MSFQDDFDLYLEKEREEIGYAEKFYKSIISNNDKNKCNIKNCCCLKRNRRDKEKCKNKEYRTKIYNETDETKRRN